MTLLPGLSDGLATVNGKALFLAKPYRLFFDRFTVYMFSRKDEMPDHYTIRDMARDQALAMEALGIKSACVMGVSQGGMIALCLALDCPAMVEKLVLAVSASRVNPIIEESVGKWIGLAEQDDHAQLMIDTAERSYSEKYLKKYRKFYPVLGRVGKPATYRRFLINANAILGFDVYGELGQVGCPTLIIAGDEDRIVGLGASEEMHEKIPGSNLFVYRGLGHAVYEEAEDFNERVSEFFE